jgi:hypothetical protein
MIKIIGLSGLLFLAGTAFAAEQVALKDGRTVQLNDDFTWHYVTVPASAGQAADPAIPQAIPAIVADQQDAILLEPGSSKPTLQLSDSGVDLLLAAAEYREGTLIIPTTLTNQGRQSIISFEIQLTLTSPEGEVLFDDTVQVWKSIKRMADTYLRPKTSELGKEIRLKVPQHSSYRLKASVSEVVTR